MDTGSLSLFALTVYRPVAQAVVTLGWPLPKFKAPGPCLIAVHAGHAYDYAAAKKIARQTGHDVPSSQTASIGIIGVGRWDGARFVEVERIAPLYCKGSPGLWSLPPEAEAQVRARYAEAMARRAAQPVTADRFPWGDC